MNVLYFIYLFISYCLAQITYMHANDYIDTFNCYDLN